MRKLSLYLVGMLVTILFVTGNAFAYSYVGMYPGNDEKLGTIKTLTGNETTEADGGWFTITYNSGLTSGTVAINNGNGGFKGYMAVKASNSFKLYYFDGIETTGAEYNWDTFDIPKGESGGYGPAVSHINFYSVPIPGAVWLLGSGILGLAGIRIRSRKRKAQS